MSNQCLGQTHSHTQTARQSLLPMLDSHSTRSHGVSSGNAFHSEGTFKKSSLKKKKKKRSCRNFNNKHENSTPREKCSNLPRIKVGQLAILAFKPW